MSRTSVSDLIGLVFFICVSRISLPGVVQLFQFSFLSDWLIPLEIPHNQSKLFFTVVHAVFIIIVINSNVTCIKRHSMLLACMLGSFEKSIPLYLSAQWLMIDSKKKKSINVAEPEILSFLFQTFFFFVWRLHCPQSRSVSNKWKRFGCVLLRKHFKNGWYFQFCCSNLGFLSLSFEQRGHCSSLASHTQTLAIKGVCWNAWPIRSLEPGASLRVWMSALLRHHLCVNTAS